jgi:hypothetical protein
VLLLEPRQLLGGDEIDRADPLALGDEPVHRWPIPRRAGDLSGSNEPARQQRRRALEALARNARHFLAARFLVLGARGRAGALLARGESASLASASAARRRACVGCCGDRGFGGGEFVREPLAGASPPSISRISAAGLAATTARSSRSPRTGGSISRDAARRRRRALASSRCRRAARDALAGDGEAWSCAASAAIAACSAVRPLRCCACAAASAARPLSGSGRAARRCGGGQLGLGLSRCWRGSASAAASFLARVGEAFDARFGLVERAQRLALGLGGSLARPLGADERPLQLRQRSWRPLRRSRRVPRPRGGGQRASSSAKRLSASSRAASAAPSPRATKPSQRRRRPARVTSHSPGERAAVVRSATWTSASRAASSAGSRGRARRGCRRPARAPRPRSRNRPSASPRGVPSGALASRPSTAASARS